MNNKKIKDEEIKSNLEDIYYSDTGSLFGLYVKIIRILSILMAVVFMMFFIVVSKSQGIGFLGFLFCLLCCLFSIFVVWAITDGMIMFAEMHYVIVHKKNNN